MLELHGIGACAGVADGPLFRYRPKRTKPRRRTVSDIPAELARLDAAIAAVKTELGALRDRALEAGMNPGDAKIFESQTAMLEDEDFLAAVRDNIQETKLCAERVVDTTGEAFADTLRGLGDPYLAARADDLTDAAKRVVAVLCDQPGASFRDLPARAVLAAETLTPSEALGLDKSKVCAFLMRGGSPESHASILARSLGIPTVTALGDEFDKLEDGARTMVDGETGLVVQCPDQGTMALLAQKLVRRVREDHSLQTLRGKPCISKHGVRIRLTANIAMPAEAKRALVHDAEGIGLFRTEFLYMERGGKPTEDYLFTAYQEVLLAMGTRRVAVRLPDFSTEKASYFPEVSSEANPALGIRPLSLLLAHPDMLNTQLRALVRASIYGNLAVLLPMVVDPQEVREVRERLEEVRRGLIDEGRNVAQKIELGVMIETPAAVMTADILAREADFLCIGTNDLAQYLLVCDRTQTARATSVQRHPAVLRAIAQAVRSAHAENVPVCICGECACDISLAGFFAGIGADELSMTPSEILKMKQAVRALSAQDCRNALERALDLAEAPDFPILENKEDA